MQKIAIIVGSVYGAAEELAETTLTRLRDAGFEAEIFVDTSLADVQSFGAEYWLLISSTTGAGDVPPNIEDFYFQTRDTVPNLSKIQYAIMAMGDSSYFDTFCGAGKALDEMMQESMAVKVLETLEIDACETMDTAEASAAWLDKYITAISV
ncbi:flavodoxin [Gayadomonas joobiniege]|uniref:flavodoxin n=1 Tax=Gayadomonas joobiniege TaxID=1234606 RepID=UPI0003687A0C|nr:flavodoxin [Gayadomonas joobiniege]